MHESNFIIIDLITGTVQHLILTFTLELILTLIDAIITVFSTLIHVRTTIQIIDTQLTRTLLNIVLGSLIQSRSGFVAVLLHLICTVKQAGCRLF